MTTALSHRSRSPRANKVRAAAVDHDVDRLQQEVTALFDAFVDQTNEERAHLVRLPTFTAEQVDEAAGASSSAPSSLSS